MFAWFAGSGRVLRLIGIVVNRGYDSRYEPGGDFLDRGYGDEVLPVCRTVFLADCARPASAGSRYAAA